MATFHGGPYRFSYSFIFGPSSQAKQTRIWTEIEKTCQKGDGCKLYRAKEDYTIIAF